MTIGYRTKNKNSEFPAALKVAIKFSGLRQSEFARCMGLNPCVFSYKLTRANFTVPEIKQLIIELAARQALNQRAEVLSMLQLAGLRQSAFSQADWQQSPLSELE